MFAGLRAEGMFIEFIGAYIAAPGFSPFEVPFSLVWRLGFSCRLIKY
jgi:hypothetical protein